MGLVVGNVARPGSGFNLNAASLDSKAVADYVGQAKTQSVTDFLMHIIPQHVVDAFAKGDILEVLPDRVHGFWDFVVDGMLISIWGFRSCCAKSFCWTYFRA